MYVHNSGTPRVIHFNQTIVYVHYIATRLKH